jgi:hypothetical protein
VRYAGVDPGLHGAIAFLDDAGQVQDLIATPLRSGGGDRRDTYDVDAIADIFRRRADPRLPDRGLFVTIEELLPMPGKMRFGGQQQGETSDAGGGFANYARGAAMGWPFMMAAYRIRPLLVLPQTWQAVMHAGAPGEKPKERSVAQALRLFPGRCLVCGKPFELTGYPIGRPMGCTPAADHPRRKKPHDGLAEALLLAQYGRQQDKGGAIFARGGVA